MINKRQCESKPNYEGMEGLEIMTSGEKMVESMKETSRRSQIIVDRRKEVVTIEWVPESEIWGVGSYW